MLRIKTFFLWLSKNLWYDDTYCKITRNVWPHCMCWRNAFMCPNWDLLAPGLFRSCLPEVTMTISSCLSRESCEKWQGGFWYWVVPSPSALLAASSTAVGWEQWEVWSVCSHLYHLACVQCSLLMRGAVYFHCQRLCFELTDFRVIQHWDILFLNSGYGLLWSVFSAFPVPCPKLP